jgi:membrane-associated phospholipid phosphatase
MFDTVTVIWLQQWASPPLTEAMRLVSLSGYVPACLAIAVVCTFGWRTHVGTLIVLEVLFADALTMAGKSQLEWPRPHAIDSRVHELGVSDAFRAGAVTARRADEFGFPSGHVATTVACAGAIATSVGSRWLVGPAVLWISAMAISRMYLGRHFPIDVLGGVAVGLLGLAVAWWTLRGQRRQRGLCHRRGRVVAGLSGIVLTWTVFAEGLGAYGAGRFVGMTSAAYWLAAKDRIDAVPNDGRLLVRLALGLLLMGVTAWSELSLSDPASLAGSAGALVVSALLSAAVLLIPGWIVPLSRR